MNLCGLGSAPVSPVHEHPRHALVLPPRYAEGRDYKVSAASRVPYIFVVTVTQNNSKVFYLSPFV